MNNDKFRRDFAKIIKAAGKASEDVVKQAAINVGKSIIYKSPADTGRFIGNWNYSSVTMNTSTTDAVDPGRTSTLAKIEAGIQTWKPGETIYILNSLPYAKRLENGWSQQSPAGMVRITVVEFRQYVAKAAREVRSV